MQRSALPILLLVLVLAVAIAAAMLGGDGSVPPPGPVPPADGGPAAGVPPGGGGDDPPVAPADAIRVHVAVRAEAVFVAPPPPRVQARQAGTGTPLPAVLLAGEGAGDDPPRPRDGTALVAVGLPDGGRVLRQIVLAADRPTECRLGARVTVRGQVADATELPLRGARVWLGEIGRDGSRVVAETDATGVFELDTPAGDGVPFVVTAASRAAQWRAVTVPGSADALRAVLAPAAVLEVQLAAAAEDAAAARVFVLPDGPVATALAQYPFFVQALDDGFPVDPTGRAQVPDLPADGSVVVVVRHPRLPGPAPHAVVLRGRPQRVVVPLQFAATAVRGRVVDAAGAPLAGVTVWSRLPGQALGAAGSARLLPPQLPSRGACRTTTGADGAFVVGALAAPDALVSLRAPDCAGIDLPAAALAAAPVVLPPWHGGECAFRLLPPAPGVPWQASCDLGGGVQAALAADSPWQVSFPHAGRFTVTVTTRRGAALGGVHEHQGLDVTGVVELQAPGPP